jgi:O-antigen ligase
VQPAATQPRRGTLLALALLLACAYAAFAHGAVRIPDETWLQVGLDVAALLAAAAWLSRREGLQTTREGWLGIALLSAFGVWCAITMLWSVAPDQSWLEANRALAYALAVMLAVGLGTVSRPAIERIAIGWLIVASAVALYALAGKVAPGALAADEPIARLRAPLEYWNALALVCAMGLPVALRAVTETGFDPRPRLAALAAAYVLLLTMGLTYSRGGFVALAVALGIVTALGRRRLRGLGAFALAAVAAGPALAVAFSLNGLTDNNATLGARIHDGRIFGAVALIMLGLLLAAGNWALRFERHRRLTPAFEAWVWQGLAAVAAVVVLGGLAYVVADHNRVWHAFADVKQDRQYDPARLVSTNSGNRWVWWKEAAGAFSDKPIGGWGAGSFGTVHLRYREQPLGVQQPHNVELQWLSETGIIGFLLALGGIALLFVAAATRLRRLEHGRERELAVALLAAAAGWLVHGVVDWDWDIPAVTLPPLIFLGVLAANPSLPPPRRAAEPFADPEPSGTGVRAVALGGIALLLCGALASAALPAISQSRTEAAETASNPDTAARDADVAARLNPVAVRPLLVASSIEVRRGRLVEARKRLLEAAGRQPENPEVWYRIAQLSQQLADRDSYQTAIARFAQLDPVNPVTGALLRQALAIQAPANASATATGTPLPGPPVTAPAPPAAP